MEKNGSHFLRVLSEFLFQVYSKRRFPFVFSVVEVI